MDPGFRRDDRGFFPRQRSCRWDEMPSVVIPAKAGNHVRNQGYWTGRKSRVITMIYHNPLFTQQPIFIQLQQLSQVYTQLLSQLFSIAPFFSQTTYASYKQMVEKLEQQYEAFLTQDVGAKWFADQINAMLPLFKKGEYTSRQ